jgi:hypothetical protein
MRAKRAHERNAKKIAKALAAYNAKQEAAKLDELAQARAADIAHLDDMVASASQQVAMVEQLPTPGNMVELQEAHNAWFGAERQIKAAASYAATKGLIEPDTLRHLTARLGPHKRRVGA